MLFASGTEDSSSQRSELLSSPVVEGLSWRCFSLCRVFLYIGKYLICKGLWIHHTVEWVETETLHLTLGGRGLRVSYEDLRKKRVVDANSNPQNQGS